MSTLSPGRVYLGGVYCDPGSNLIVQQGTVNVQDAIGRESTADFTALDMLAAHHYDQNTPVLIYDGANALAFAGWISNDTEHVLSQWASAPIPVLEHKIQATDNHYLANKRRVGKAWAATTAGAIFTDVIANYLAVEGVYHIRNMLSVNASSFETDTSGTTAVSGATRTRVTTEHWTGAAALQVVTPGSVVNEGVGLYLADTAYRPGQLVMASVYLKGTGNVVVKFVESGVSQLGFVNITLTSTWTRYSVLATLPNPLTSGHNYGIEVCTRTSAQAITFYVDGAMIEPRPNGADDAALRGPSPWELGQTSTVQTGGTVTSLTAGYVPASDVFDACAKRSQYYWEIDQDRRAWFAARGTTVAPWTFDGSQDAGDTVRVKTGNPNYRNKQFVGGGTAETSSQVEIRLGDGNTQAWVMAYPIAHVPTVETNLNGAGYVAKTVGIRGVDTGKDFYWQAGDNTLTQDSAGTKLRGPTGTIDLLRCTYIGQFPFIASSTDDGQIATETITEGNTTSGLVEDFIGDSTLDSISVAFEVATSNLQRNATKGRILTFSTYESGLAPGQMLTVNLPIHGITTAAPMLIESVNIKTSPGFYLLYSVTALFGPVNATWLEFFKTLVGNAEQADIINLGSGSSLVTLATFTAALTITASYTATVFACPICGPSTLCGPGTIVC
jgi:hypothetical protein